MSLGNRSRIDGIRQQRARRLTSGSCDTSRSQIFQDVPLLLTQSDDRGQHTFDKAAAGGTLGAEATPPIAADMGSYIGQLLRGLRRGEI